MGLILKQSQVAGNNATQVQIGTINEEPIKKQKKADEVICDIADWIKTVALLCMLPGLVWFFAGWFRVVLMDIYNRCSGSWWVYVFWTVLGMHVGGYLLMMLGCLLYQRHQDPHKTGVDIEAA